VKKAADAIAGNLAQMKLILFGQAGAEPNLETCQALAHSIYSADLIPLLLTNLALFEFEAKKDAVSIFNNLLRRQVGGRSPTVEYICRNTAILDTLIEGYEDADVALNCGAMLRECVQFEALAKIMLHAPSFFNYFTYVEMNNFDVASDAFATFKDLLTVHKTLAAEFLERNYDKIFDLYTKLLKSGNYVTKRQSLKLLGELLLDRSNFSVMTRYISDVANLKLMMTLLRDKSKSTQFEAFHVFKVFVANPKKSKPILQILQRNKDKLIKFLSTFHDDKAESDEQFKDERAFLLKQIGDL
jgi:calcium binding protein 39